MTVPKRPQGQKRKRRARDGDKTRIGAKVGKMVKAKGHIVRLNVFAAILILSCTAIQSCAVYLSNPKTVCSIMHARAKHLGETITFDGEYLTDNIERPLILPNGCDLSIIVGQISSDANKTLTSADRPPLKSGRKVEATFTGTLVQGQPNGLTYKYDDGVRIDLSSIAKLKITDPQSY
jgi:hypothetical protein